MKTVAVTFLSDFGLDDPYVAEVKGVLLRSLEAVTVVDVTHLVPAFAVELGAFHLLQAYRHFPDGTFHLAVVDPGVGTARRCLYVRTARHHFVGPDNGLLRWAVEDAEARDGKKAEAFAIPVPASASSTFHARDVFAPFLAERARDRSPFSGERLEKLAGRAFPGALEEADGYRGEVVAVDRYGNVITSIPVFDAKRVTARLGGGEEISEAATYGAIAPGRAGVLRGSHGFWELAAREDSAARLLRAKPGDEVRLLI